jgi:hypothetical protein
MEAAAVVRQAHLSAGIAVAALFFSPRLSWACPSCAGNPDGGALRYVLIGLMIAAPYVAATVAIRLIRKGEADARADAPIPRVTGHSP